MSDPTNGELALMIANLGGKVSEHFSDMKEEISEVKAQTTKTNGRVTGLEKWSWTISGGMVVVVVVILPVLLDIAKRYIAK